MTTIAIDVHDRICQDLHQQIRSLIVENEKLRAALAEPVLNPAPGYCKHCKQYTIEEPLPAEPVQEPVAWSFEARHIDTAFGPAVSIRHPGREHKYMRNVKPLYTAPPQRQPLTEEEIQAAWDSVDMRHPRGNETRIAFGRAIERAHGIGGQP